MKWFKNVSNANKVAYMGVVSLILSVLLYWLVDKYDGSLLDLNGFWTFYTLVVSSPVAFIIWNFRDQNVAQQIENSRKDTNLKEFQKLAEWVSGTHFVEEKVSIKTKYEKTENLEQKIIEKTREYTTPSNELSIQTYSKMDGAVGLQIAAVYNLLPFYRGDYGESFKKPALNLLTSAWLALQRKELNILEKEDISEEEECNAIRKLQDNAKSPLGAAITRVLLSLNNQGIPCLTEHKEIFPGLCLAGMDFHISGVDRICLSIFKGMDCPGINMIGSYLVDADFEYSNLRQSKLLGAYLYKANLNNAKLSRANLRGADLHSAILTLSCLVGADLKKASLRLADLTKSDLLSANLMDADLACSQLIDANLRGSNCMNANFNSANLIDAEFTEAFLTEASLKNATLIRSDLNNTNLNKADLTGANLLEAKLKLYHLAQAHWKKAVFESSLRKKLEECEIIEDISIK